MAAFYNTSVLAAASRSPNLEVGCSPVVTWWCLGYKWRLVWTILYSMGWVANRWANRLVFQNTTCEYGPRSCVLKLCWQNGVCTTIGLRYGLPRAAWGRRMVHDVSGHPSCFHREGCLETSRTIAAWASYQIHKIAGWACTRNAGNVFPATDFNR